MQGKPVIEFDTEVRDYIAMYEDEAFRERIRADQTLRDVHFAGRSADSILAEMDKRLAQLKFYGTVEVPKIRRNDPCPCGSGRKFKKCCIDVAP